MESGSGTSSRRERLLPAKREGSPGAGVTMGSRLPSGQSRPETVRRRRRKAMEFRKERRRTSTRHTRAMQLILSRPEPARTQKDALRLRNEGEFDWHRDSQ